MEHSAIKAEVRNFIVEEFQPDIPASEITDDLALIDAGVIDSMLALRLLAFLEDEFDIEVTPDDMSRDHMGSINGITALVMSKRGQGPAPVEPVASDAAPVWKTTPLHALFERAAEAWPERTAIVEPSCGRDITYAALDELSARARNVLARHGVGRGARVGLCVRKSIDAVAAVLGTLRAGAAYVPVDPGAPMARDAFILADCAVEVVFVESRLEPSLRAELEAAGAKPRLIVLPEAGGGDGLRSALASEETPKPSETEQAWAPEDLAYILYTSGSTGRPKGVMLSHENAVSFVEWSRELVQPTPADRFSSHAPLHFDLSILDLYVALTSGAALVLVGGAVAREPRGLAQWIADQGITVWYSAPSILSMLAQYGKLSRYDYSALRVVLFAGEVFPIKHLRALKGLWPAPAYFNLYGPTETNVCTFHPIPETVGPEREEPYPIGRACSHLDVRVVDASGAAAAPGEEGELQVIGPGVTSGYWNLQERTRAAFTEDGWYRTGDIVFADQEDDGALVFVGRRDRMVKRRAYRVELGEIEAALYRHEHVSEVAAVALPDPDSGVVIKVYLTWSGEGAPSVLALREFATQHLPLYMLPDRISVIETMPKTSTDKIDYQNLRARG